jgi:CheY-like chemotaxis protein
MVDEQYLSQVLTNLLGNALKFTHSGSIRIESGKSDESQAFIRVSDTGIGISREFLPEIFEEFKQESGGYGRSYEGSGLGLTITKKLVELMNGTIKIESEQGIGTSITLTFPIGKEERLLVGPEGILKSDQSDSRPASTNGRLPRVLLVEDTQETSQMVKIFTRGKCELDIAHNAETALELASQHSYDLVLMDVNLGNGRSGLDVACDLRKDVRYGSTPIIALTAYAMKGDKESAIAAGCTDYLSKPFNKADLLAKLKQFIPA